MRISSTFIVLAIPVSLILAGCANIGAPSGGPRDEDPPYLVKADPPYGSLNVTKDHVSLTFNEIINLKDAYDKVVLSPAGRAPRVSAQGHKIDIRFDSLAPNTTYTVDFANTIEDNNEGNKLRNFAYTFSTGPSIDTLRISGRVLGSRDLEPRPGIIVGVTDNTTDTAFVKTPLLRVAKADDRGQFIIRGLAPGNYRVFALGDKNSDFIYSADDEEAAFMDVTVSPSAERTEALDTVYNTLTGTVDSVITRRRTRFLPNDILLRTFVSDRKVQYISRYERPDSNRLFLKLNAPLAKLPSMRLLGQSHDFPHMVESRPQLDSITIWLPPSLAALDTLALAVDYTRQEWNKLPEEMTDTLRFIRRKLPAPKKKKKVDAAEAARDSLARLTTPFTFLGGAQQEVWKPIALETAAPLARLDTAMIRLEEMKDSVWRAVPGGKLSVFRPDSVSIRTMTVDYPWDYGTKYRLKVDSVAGTDIYGRTTLPLISEFTTRKAGDYCTLALNITGLEPGIPAFVELLDGSDNLMRTAEVKNGKAFFPFLASGKYFARVIEDYNGNGYYDTGDFQTLRQPDLAYYYPKPINIKKNWDKEENWDLWATPIDQQKPAAVLKNKPETPKHKRNSRDKNDRYDEEEEEIFDPTANPFEDEDTQRRRQNRLRRQMGNGL